MQIDTGNEFWQMNASLNVHDGAGKPVPVPDNVRMYFAASHSHTGATGLAARPTAKGICEYPVSGARSHDSLLRALMVALDDWADRGISPPKSVYPDRKNGALVTVDSRYDLSNCLVELGLGLPRRVTLDLGDQHAMG